MSKNTNKEALKTVFQFTVSVITALLAKLTNPYTDPATEKQKAQREKFAAKQTAAIAWLNANRPGTKNGEKGTALYQQAQKLKRTYAFSNVNQVLYKYINDKNGWQRFNYNYADNAWRKRRRWYKLRWQFGRLMSNQKHLIIQISNSVSC